MKMMTMGTLAACAALAMPGAALADAMQHDAMAGAPMATMLCRPATAGEKPATTMTLMVDKKVVNVVCKTMTAEMHDKAKSGPDLSKALSAGQVDAAWRRFLDGLMAVPVTGGG